MATSKAKVKAARKKAAVTRKRNRAAKKGAETRRRRKAAKLGVFTKTHRDEMSEKRFMEVKAYEERFGRLPPVKDTKLGKWLCNMRAAKKGRRGGCSYPEILDKLCKQFKKRYFDSGTPTHPVDHKSRAKIAKRNAAQRKQRGKAKMTNAESLAKARAAKAEKVSQRIKIERVKMTEPRIITPEPNLIDFDYLKKNAPRETVSREKLERLLENLTKAEDDLEMLVAAIGETKNSVANVLRFLENL